MTDSERLDAKLKRKGQDPLSDSEFMNGLLGRCGCDDLVFPGQMMVPRTFCLLFERILDRLDRVEGELDRLKSFTPTIT